MDKIKLLLYCAKGKPYLYGQDYEKFKSACFMTDTKREYTELTSPYWLTTNHNMGYGSLNGKIVGECDFEVEEIRLVETPEYAGSECNTFLYDVSINFETKTLNENELCQKSCLSAYALAEYLPFYNVKKCMGYAIHIKNLHIFDKPKELNEYDDYEYEVFSGNGGCLGTEWKPLEKAPQNMRYCYDGGEKKILIPVHPEELCRIINGEQDVIIKKKVLKEML